MIIYNMRYRGPYEYDKFVLNVFQYHNEVNDIKEMYLNEDLKPNMEQINTLNKLINELSSKRDNMDKLLDIYLRLE